MPEAILWGLVEWALRATMLAAVVSLLLWGLRVKDVALRLAAWTAVLLGVLLLPMVALVPQLSIKVPRPPVKIEFGNPQSAHQPETAVTKSTSDTKSIPLRGNTASVQNSPTQTSDLPKTNAPGTGTVASHAPLWSEIAIGLWLIIAAAMLFKLLLGLWLSRRLVDASTEIEEGIRESSAVTVPVTVGLIRPVILLPSDWRDWDEQKIRAVLAHEQSHVSRHDPLCQLVASVYRALCWFHPLAWWLSAKLAECAEAASDDAALQAVPGHVQYAEILLAFLERAPRRVQWTGIPMAQKDTAAKRIDRILDSRRRLSISLTRGTVLALALLAVPVIYMAAALHPVWAALPAASSQGTRNTSPSENLSPRERELTGESSAHVPTRNGTSSQQAPLSFLNAGNQQDTEKGKAPEQPLTGAPSTGGGAQSETDASQASPVAESLAAPLQLSPANGTAWSEYRYPRRIEFQWSQVPGAVSYGIEVNCFHCCVSGKWCSDVRGATHIVRGLTEPSYTMEGYYGSQPGSWRVWAINGKVEDGPTSPWWEFTFSAANDLMRLPPLPKNNAPPAHSATVLPGRSAPVQSVYTAPKDNALGPDGRLSEAVPASAPSTPSRPVSSARDITTPVKAIYAPDPSYTDAARKAKIGGEVLLYVTIGADGLVKNVSVRKSLTPDLDESAVNTVKTWRFEPARKNGVAVPISTTVMVSFSVY